MPKDASQQSADGRWLPSRSAAGGHVSSQLEIQRVHRRREAATKKSTQLMALQSAMTAEHAHATAKSQSMLAEATANRCISPMQTNTRSGVLT
jgi:hypothetical protein